MSDTQAIAARLTAIAADAYAHWDADRDHKVGKILSALAGQSPGYRTDIDELHAQLAHVETLIQQVADAKSEAKDIESLARRTLKAEQQRDAAREEADRLAAAKAEAEQFIRDRTTPRQGIEPQYDQSDADAFYLAEENRSLKQQRDAAHAALKRIRGWDMLDATADGPFWKRELDAALAASAPQKEEQ